MKTIVSNIENKDGMVNIEQIVDKHYETIQTYGNTQGWPVEVGLIKNKNEFILADIKNEKERITICKGTIHKDSGKLNVATNILNDINFLI